MTEAHEPVGQRVMTWDSPFQGDDGMWRRFAPEISVILVLCLAGSAWAGLIGHWKLDEGTGTTVKDSSGKNNNGRFMGAPKWVDGRLGKALDFDGADDYVEVPHSASLIPTKGKATVSLWINARRHRGPNNSQWQGIFAKGSWDPRLFNLYTEASEVLHFSTGPGNNTVGSLSTGKVPLNEWVHIAVAVDGQHIYYINGEPAGVGGQGATVPATGSAALTIGQTGGGDYFSGMIDDVQLYDRALTAEQVRGIANGTNPVFGKAENPNPINGATGLTVAFLTWTPGDAAVFENVYFGTTPDLTDADLVSSRQPASMKFYVHQTGLISGQTYYWRVDGIDIAQNVYKGDLWSFTAAPVKSYAPSPTDGARFIMPDAKLSWSPGSSASSFELFFSTNRDDVAAGASAVSRGELYEMTFDPGPLANDTAYYWRVDGIDVMGARETGYVWSFRTLPAIPVADPNLVGWWKLDEVSGPTVVDWSGHNNHGALRGGPQRVAGYDGGALKFNGSSDYVEVPHSDTLIPTSGKATVSVWINAERHTGPGGATWQGVFAKGGAPRLYNLFTEASGVLHFSTGASGAYTGSLCTGKVPLNEWVHVAAVVDGKHIYYLNGEPAGEGGQGATVPTGGTAALTIGKTDEANYFLGMIDDVRLYNTALTQEQIKAAMRGDPLLAWGAQPADGSTVDVRAAASLAWQPGNTADKHDVYFGKDAGAVTDADACSPEYKGRQADPSYSVDGLVEFGGGTYFWRIDEVEAGAKAIHKGHVWAFTVADYLIVDGFESYTDNNIDLEAIFQTWIDGWGYTTPAPGGKGNDTGSTVGYGEAPFDEHTIVHGGRQSMPLEYNNIGQPYYSETDRTWTVGQDLTLNGMDTLSLWFRGQPIKFVDKGNNAFTVSASGGDIYGTADDFRFVYKRLSGNGSITTRVESIGNSDGYAKAGVMVRATLDADSMYALVALSPANGTTFEYRPAASANAASGAAWTGGTTKAPYWLRLTRTGNALKAETSPDGKTWTVSGADQTITMASNVYIGLCVTSHNAAASTTAEFSDTAATGGVSGEWQQVWIGDDPDLANTPANLYVAITDSSNKTAVVNKPDLNAVLTTIWTEWQIPLSQFTGANPRTMKKMVIGVGDRKATAPGGTGKLYIDDIRVIKPAAQP